MIPKRKATAGAVDLADEPVAKKLQTASISEPHPCHEVAEKHGVVLRKYYPPEINNARALAYKDNLITRPIEDLYSVLQQTVAARKNAIVGESVVHWFKRDLRTRDNTALSMASDRAKEAGVPLIGLFVVSPQDWEAHFTAPIQVDFVLRTLEVLKADLDRLDIPLHIELVDKRKEVPQRIAALLDDWGANHLYANLEYEVDELRRETKIAKMLGEQEKAFELAHDTCVAPPGKLMDESQRQYVRYSPWHRSWLAHIHSNPELLELFPKPARNPASARERYGDLFNSEIPDVPSTKRLSAEDAKRYAFLWPAGEHEAQRWLELFCDEKIIVYGVMRNFPAQNRSSTLSVHLANGTISARTCVRTARDCTNSVKLDDGSEGFQTWINGFAWRDFYKHVLVNWPFICMNRPFRLEYSDIEWSYNMDEFNAWTQGKTGFPIVDAAMRQLKQIGYMHNRARMIVASFLSKDLLIDWRLGERWFMENLIDGDFASNNGGWGFTASWGVAGHAFFRIFNPVVQSEKFDADGDYIRKWVPELQEVKGQAVHDPYGRGAGDIAEKAGYPKQIVDHKASYVRALATYKKMILRGK